MNREDKMCLGAMFAVIIAFTLAGVYNWQLQVDKNEADSQKRDNVGFGESYTTSSATKFSADIIKVHYTSHYTNGTVIATTRADVATDVGVKRSAFFEGPADKNEDGVPEDHPVKMEWGVPGKLPDTLRDALKGARAGETHEITLPPEDSYGPDSKDLVRRVPLQEEIAILETLGLDEFGELYPDQFTEVGVSFTHRFWGWPVSISGHTNETVTLRNQPEVPFEVKTLPWKVTADQIYLERNVIQVTHHPTAQLVGGFVDLDLLKLYDLLKFGDIPQLKKDLGQMDHSNTDGLVTTVNDGIIIDFNREMNGEWIVYEVEILDLEIEKV